MRLLFLLSMISILFGCDNQTPQPKSPEFVQVIPQNKEPELKRIDLPSNWFEVRKDNWSYGLPVGFDPVIHTDDVLAHHYNMNTNLTTIFNKSLNINGNLFAFVDSYINKQKSNGKSILAVKDNGTGVNNLIIVIHILSNKTDNKYDASLDFFTQRGQVIYYMSCSSEALNLKINSNICFDIIDTLKIE